MIDSNFQELVAFFGVADLIDHIDLSIDMILAPTIDPHFIHKNPTEH